jgi:NADPH:quinone reductase-like Zn-dependent oxidoreductase
MAVNPKEMAGEIDRMRAVVYENYGSPEVLRFSEVDKPRPKDREILIRNHATTVTSADWRLRSLTVPAGFGPIIRLVAGVSRPRQPILGSELCGVVESVGRAVRRFQPGDPVFAFTDTALGCHAEFICIAEDGCVARKPATLTDAEAAALCFGGTTALAFLRRAHLSQGERVLIHGASGAVGTAAVQLARHFGAEVTAVCSSANGELVRSLGASHVIDYTREDFTTNGERYDVILDTVGTAPFSRCRGSLKQGGRLGLIVAGLAQMLQAPWLSLTTGTTVLAAPVTSRPEDLRCLAELAEAGAFKPVIDRCYPFEQIVEAHRYVDSGRKRGNVVITFSPDPLARVRL